MLTHYGLPLLQGLHCATVSLLTRIVGFEAFLSRCLELTGEQ